ncbi:RHS repeat domain-containing protein [Aliikangiella sp. IMCC44359]|uniref:RHS repeat domain-containing protein n=1 Tax=Aliikangiella sp. IMCC44359 TaxID=3459125 RepID=UPI00403AD8CC
MRTIKKNVLRLKLISFGVALTCSNCIASVEKILDWQYDHQGRLTEEAIDANHLVKYSLYSYHNQATRIEANNQVIIRSTHFNEDGTAQSVGYSANNQTTATYQYSPFSSPLESYFSVNGESVFKEENMRYDSRGYLISLTKLFQGSPQNYQYDYDAMGRLQTFQVGTSQVNYGYDNAGNLSRKSGFNRHGLSVTPLTTQSFNAQYQNKNWDYDDDGRVIDDGEFSYQYNDAGRLVLVTDKVSEEWVAHYIYDGAGNRVRKMMPDKTTYYYRNSQGNVAFEETYDNQSGELIEAQRHVSQGGANVASIKQVPGQSAVVEYQFSGRLGSQSVRWTEAGEVLTQDYSPFGEQMNKADLHEGTYGFTQHEDDVDTESIYMKARHYKPIYGRMNRPDPARDFNIFNASSFNLYAYVGNNPVNAWDPTGLQTALGHYCAQTQSRSSKCSEGKGQDEKKKNTAPVIDDSEITQIDKDGTQKGDSIIELEKAKQASETTVIHGHGVPHSNDSGEPENVEVAEGNFIIYIYEGINTTKMVVDAFTQGVDIDALAKQEGVTTVLPGETVHNYQLSSSEELHYDEVGAGVNVIKIRGTQNWGDIVSTPNQGVIIATFCTGTSQCSGVISAMPAPWPGITRTNIQ